MVYFISDLHLGASYISDHHAHERRVAAFLDRISGDATELYLLGDVLDYWYEYRTVVPRGYIRFFGALARLADRGVHITWITGNHDIWLFDYLSHEIGIEVIDAPMVRRVIGGRQFLLSHGDRIGCRSMGFRLICKLFRNRLCQRLYASVHPRWTVPLAHSWSCSSRAGGSKRPVNEHVAAIIADVTPLATSTPHPDYIILGHHHLELDTTIAAGTRLIVLGDWIEHDTYARYDGRDVQLLNYK